jgi:hypothetical protein
VPPTTRTDLPATVTESDARPPPPANARTSSVPTAAATSTIAPATLALRNNTPLPPSSSRRRLFPSRHLPSTKATFRRRDQSPTALQPSDGERSLSLWTLWPTRFKGGANPSQTRLPRCRASARRRHYARRHRQSELLGLRPRSRPTPSRATPLRRPLRAGPLPSGQLPGIVNPLTADSQ